jgi:hypothetical protein
LLIVICAPITAVATGVFIATATARCSSVRVEAAVLPPLPPLPPSYHCAAHHRQAAAAAAVLPFIFIIIVVAVVIVVSLAIPAPAFS